MNDELGVLLLLLSVGVFARAQTTAPAPDKDDTQAMQTKTPDKENAVNKGTQKQADKLSKEFGVPESKIQAMRSQGMGWGEVRHALAIAKKSGKPLSDVLALRRSGMGWGQIARHYGFTLGQAEGRGRRVTARSGRGPASRPPAMHGRK